MKTIRIFFSIIFFITCFGISNAYNYGEIKKLYATGDYDKAIEELNRISEEEGVSGELYYDLGNAYYNKGDFGNARIFYERAYKLDPTNKAIKNNLSYISGKIEDSNKAFANGKKVNVNSDQLSFFESVNQLISVERTSDYWSDFAIMSFILTLFFLALYLFSKNVAARKVGFFSTGIFLFFAIVFNIFSFMAAKTFNSKDDGVLLEYQTTLLTEPTTESETVATPLSRGTKVRIISSEENKENHDGWYKVRLNSDFGGWVKSKDIEII